VNTHPRAVARPAGNLVFAVPIVFPVVPQNAPAVRVDGDAVVVGPLLSRMKRPVFICLPNGHHTRGEQEKKRGMFRSIHKVLRAFGYRRDPFQQTVIGHGDFHECVSLGDDELGNVSAGFADLLLQCLGGGFDHDLASFAADGFCGYAEFARSGRKHQPEWRAEFDSAGVAFQRIGDPRAFLVTQRGFNETIAGLFIPEGVFVYRGEPPWHAAAFQQADLLAFGSEVKQAGGARRLGQALRGVEAGVRFGVGNPSIEGGSDTISSL